MQRLAQAVEQKASIDEIFFVWGYHQLWHGELSRTLLNGLSDDQPIAVIHRSFHEVYLNDAAINVLGITEVSLEEIIKLTGTRAIFMKADGWLWRQKWLPY